MTITQNELQGIVEGLKEGDISSLVALWSAVVDDEEISEEKRGKVNQVLRHAVENLFDDLTGILHDGGEPEDRRQRDFGRAHFLLRGHYHRHLNTLEKDIRTMIDTDGVNHREGLEQYITDRLESSRWHSTHNLPEAVIFCSDFVSDAEENGVDSVHNMAYWCMFHDLLGRFSDLTEKWDQEETTESARHRLGWDGQDS